MSKWDDAIEIAQSNESGAARCVLATDVELLISDRGDCFSILDNRPGAKRAEKFVSAAWAHKFLSRAFNVKVISFDW